MVSLPKLQANKPINVEAQRVVKIIEDTQGKISTYLLTETYLGDIKLKTITMYSLTFSKG